MFKMNKIIVFSLLIFVGCNKETYLKSQTLPLKPKTLQEYNFLKQALTEKELNESLHKGMTKNDVLDTLGKPTLEKKDSKISKLYFTYLVKPKELKSGWHNTGFSVEFENGKVVFWSIINVMDSNPIYFDKQPSNGKKKILFQCKFVKKYNNKNDIILAEKVLLKNEDIINAQAIKEAAVFGISLTLNSDATKRFKTITKDNLGKRLAILLNGQVKSVPTIITPIQDGHIVVTVPEIKSEEEAKKIAAGILANQNLSKTKKKDKK